MSFKRDDEESNLSVKKGSFEICRNGALFSIDSGFDVIVSVHTLKAVYKPIGNILSQKKNENFPE